MPWWAWVCLGIFVVALVAGAAALVVSLIALGRASGKLQRSTRPLVESLERSSATLQERGQAFAHRQETFRASQARAQESYRGLLVLWDALGEVRLGLRILRFALARR
jgi:hypothetical protein